MSSWLPAMSVVDKVSCAALPTKLPYKNADEVPTIYELRTGTLLYVLRSLLLRNICHSFNTDLVILLLFN